MTTLDNLKETTCYKERQGVIIHPSAPWWFSYAKCEFCSKIVKFNRKTKLAVRHYTWLGKTTGVDIKWRQKNWRSYLTESPVGMQH